MAMGAIMKKIIISPRIGSMQTLNRVIPPCSTTTTSVIEDRKRDLLKNEAVISDLEERFKDWSISSDSERDGGLDWVHSIHELWKEKNEDEQRRHLDLYWKYLKNYLHRQGINTNNHRLLMSMKYIEEPPRHDPERRNIVEFTVASPDRGLVSISRLVFDRGTYVSLPRQSVNGLLCITTNKAFLMHNPITGETSPWIEINRSNRKPRRKPNHIAFGFDPQSDEHKVICLGKAVEVFTVGKNTWRRIDTTPPMHLTSEDPLYVDGCIYWRFRGNICTPREPELIMKFDIVEFRVIQIPDSVIGPWDHKYTLCIMHEDADGDIEWTEENIHLDYPDDWNGKPELSIEALTGKNLIFLQSDRSDSVVYYNRITDQFTRFPISPDFNPFRWKRIIQVWSRGYDRS